MKTLKPFQKVGAKFLAMRQTALLADEMGLGKTLQAIAAFRVLKLKTALIVCPATVKLGWRDELVDAGYSNIHAIESGARFHCADIYVVNFDMVINGRLPIEMKDFCPDALILDEIHKLKTIDSARTLEILGKGGWAHRAKRVWGLSGTPVLNRPVELFPILKTLYPNGMGEYKTYEKFAQRYCGAFFDGHALNAKGSSNLDELAHQMSGFMLRRTQREVLPELPTYSLNIHRLEKTGEGYKELDKVEMDILSRTTKESFISEKMSQLGDLATLCKATALAKLPQVIEHIKSSLDTGERVVVFVHHREVGDALANALGEFKPVFVRGGQSSDQRRAAIEAFQKDSQVLIGNIVAAGTGLDGLQKVCRRIVFAEISWVPGEMAQCICRCVRMGQRYMTLVDYLVAENTIEEAKLQVIFRKEKAITRLMTQPQPDTKNKTERTMTLMGKLEALLDNLIIVTDRMAEGKQMALPLGEQESKKRGRAKREETAVPAAEVDSSLAQALPPAPTPELVKEKTDAEVFAEFVEVAKALRDAIAAKKNIDVVKAHNEASAFTRAELNKLKQKTVPALDKAGKMQLIQAFKLELAKYTTPTAADEEATPDDVLGQLG